MVKHGEMNRAINLRKKGLSYREILERILVSKSTLSLWLRSVGLSNKQKQRLTLKKLGAAKRGAQAQRNKRLKAIEDIKAEAKAEISKIPMDRTKLWLMGTMLYWAEGSKEKINGPSGEVRFGNSDPIMIKLFIKWLIEICNIHRSQIIYEIYLHENHEHRLQSVKMFWADHLSLNAGHFKIYFKRHNISAHRKNIGEDYFGLVRVRVRKSSALIRRIGGWIEGISRQWRVV